MRAAWRVQFETWPGPLEAPSEQFIIFICFRGHSFITPRWAPRLY